MPPKSKHMKQIKKATHTALTQLPAKFQHALAFHQQGRLARAQSIYGEILRIQPEHFDALHMSGVIALQTNHPKRALDLFKRAIEIDPNDATARINCGSALLELKQYDAALAIYDSAIAIDARRAEAFCYRGLALQALKQFDAAWDSYNRAIAINANFAEAFFNRGNLMEELKRFETALASYDQAITIQPDYAEAYSNRGLVLMELAQLDASLSSFDQAISLKSDYAEAYSNRGLVLYELHRFDAALASYNQAIAIKPDYAEAYSNRHHVLQRLNQPDAALASCNHAIAIKADYAHAHSNRGNVLKEMGRLDAALASYNRAIAIQTDYAEAYCNRSVLMLLRGDFDNGWMDYEWRWKNENCSSFKESRSLPKPLWLGKDSLTDKTIFLHCEQGMGDTLQFCRYAKLVADLGARVLLEVQRPLATLLADLAGVSEIIIKGSVLPDFDYHCPLLSLPLAFKTNLSTIPSSSKYLHADAAKVAQWQARLGDKTKPRIGLTWSGNELHVNDHNRSIRLADLIRQLPAEFQYVSLQKDMREFDRPILDNHPHVWNFAEDLHDFGDTAALCECLDLVITVDTSVAHLSAALGKTTWILLPSNPDWRWLLDRSDSPWYPAVKLYRQRSIGDWIGVFARVKEDLIESFKSA